MKSWSQYDEFLVHKEVDLESLEEIADQMKYIDIILIMHLIGKYKNS